MRSRSERRHKDFSKAMRKQEICRRAYGFPYYDNLHEYSKNKIHCSCGMCRLKTNNKSNRHTWYPSMNWSMMDRRRLDEMSDQEEEFEGDLYAT